ncbi:MAG: AraC family transcriptional regulator [Bacteroidia bacterium]|nr:AraC family transcriptional regulator [Bacteroidia bacterium]
MTRQELIPLVESRHAWTLDRAELSLYETSMEAYRVPLTFRDPVVTSMIMGKKVMHLEGRQPFEYLPGEALLMPSNEPMHIDFPEATLGGPTKCLALTISPEFIRSTLDQFAASIPRLEESGPWAWYDRNFHFTQSADVHYTLNRIVRIFQENHAAKDHFAESALQELLLRVMQTHARHLLIRHCQAFSSHHRLAYAVEYIRAHLDRQIRIEKLCDQACLSRAQFYRAFKQEFGLSPVDFVNQERVKRAWNILRQPGKSVTDACYESGFNSLSYFNRVFKRWTGLAPSQHLSSRGQAGPRPA